MRLRRVRLVLVAAATLAAVGLVCASASRGGGQAGVGKLHPRTLAVLPTRVSGLVADGRRLAWWIRARERQGCALKIQVFDRATRRLATIRPDLNCEVPKVLGTALAGRRVLWGVGGFGLSGRYASVHTATVAGRRPHALVEDLVVEDARFGYPARIAGGGGRLAFLTFWKVWRVAGGKALRVPYDPEPLVGFAVEGRRLATANWVGKEGRDWQPSWSPDGREIAWNHDGAIWLMQADGSAQHELAGAGHVAAGSGPRWSPDGRTLAFESEGAIDLIGRDGSNPRRLLTGALPAWSPDGRVLALVRSNDLWVVGVDGSNAHQLTSACHDESSSSSAFSSRPDWSPDGRSLAFACQKSSLSGHLYLVDVASGIQQDLTPAGLSPSDPAWSPDGARIAFAGFTSGSRLYAIRADGSGLTKLTQDAPPLWDEREPVWSPDGHRLAYTTYRYSEQGYEIWTVNADGSGQLKLENPNLAAVTPQWSPDGKTIIVGDNNRGEAYGGAGGVYALDPAGGKSRLLAAPTNPPTVELRDIVSGKLLRQWQVPGVSAVWLSQRFLVAKTSTSCRRYDLATGSQRGASPCRRWTGLSLAGNRGVYRIGRRIFLLDLKSGRRSTLALTGAGPVGPLIEGERVYWGENYRKGSRIHELVLR